MVVSGWLLVIGEIEIQLLTGDWQKAIDNWRKKMHCKLTTNNQQLTTKP
jgi:hypothetical protein